MPKMINQTKNTKYKLTSRHFWNYLRRGDIFLTPRGTLQVPIPSSPEAPAYGQYITELFDGFIHLKKKNLALSMLPEYLSALLILLVCKSQSSSFQLWYHEPLMRHHLCKRKGRMATHGGGYGWDWVKLTACPAGVPRPLTHLECHGSGSLMQMSFVKCAPLEQRLRPRAQTAWGRADPDVSVQLGIVTPHVGIS